MTDSSLWVLFFSLFLLVLLILMQAVIQTCIVFAARYCFCVRSGLCCCYIRIDWEAHRRERDSLRRLRELRQRNRHFVLGELSTYSQIPGVVPDSHIFGFVLVPEAPRRLIREQLTPEQRRRILDRLLVCDAYTPDWNASPSNENVVDNHNLSSDMEEGQIMVRPNATIDQDSTERDRDHEPISIAIPGHEEPVNDNTCAICLDEFVDGELINDPNKCRHYFHKDCLVGWLDQHDVCPCCRRTMVTEQEWKRAIEEEHLHLVQNGGQGPTVALRN